MDANMHSPRWSGWQCVTFVLGLGLLTAVGFFASSQLLMSHVGTVHQAICGRAADEPRGHGHAPHLAPAPTPTPANRGHSPDPPPTDLLASLSPSGSSPSVDAEYADMDELVPAVDKPAELPLTQQINITAERFTGTSMYVCEFHNLYYNIPEQKFYSLGQEMHCVRYVHEVVFPRVPVVSGVGVGDVSVPLSMSSVGYISTPIFYDIGLYNNLFHAIGEHMYVRWATIAQLQGRTYTVKKHNITIMEDPHLQAIGGYGGDGRRHSSPWQFEFHESAFGVSDYLSHASLTRAFPRATWLLCRHVYYSLSFFDVPNPQYKTHNNGQMPFRIAYVGHDYVYNPVRTLFSGLLSPPSDMARWHLRYSDYLARSLGFSSKFSLPVANQTEYITIINRAIKRKITNAQQLHTALTQAIDTKQYNVHIPPVQDWPEQPKAAIALARRSKIIIAMHGAGAFWLSFMRPGGYYLEIEPWRCDLFFTMYGTLASRHMLVAEQWAPQLPVSEMVPPPVCDYQQDATLDVPSIVHMVLHYLHREPFLAPAYKQAAWNIMTANSDNTQTRHKHGTGTGTGTQTTGTGTNQTHQG